MTRAHLRSIAVLVGLGIAFHLAVGVPAKAEVLKIVVNDTIQPISDEFIGRAITDAEQHGDQALLIELNTHGGLVDSTL